MFDFIFANSYIEVSYERKYLKESYETLLSKIKDNNTKITVTVIDFLGFEDVKTFNKKDITSYGSN